MPTFRAPVLMKLPILRAMHSSSERVRRCTLITIGVRRPQRAVPTSRRRCHTSRAITLERCQQETKGTRNETVASL